MAAWTRVQLPLVRKIGGEAQPIFVMPMVLTPKEPLRVQQIFHADDLACTVRTDGSTSLECPSLLQTKFGAGQLDWA